MEPHHPLLHLKPEARLLTLHHNFEDDMDLSPYTLPDLLVVTICSLRNHVHISHWQQCTENLSKVNSDTAELILQS